MSVFYWPGGHTGGAQVAAACASTDLSRNGTLASGVPSEHASYQRRDLLPQIEGVWRAVIY